MKEFSELSQLFVSLGGSERFLKSLRASALNIVRLRYEVRKLQKNSCLNTSEPNSDKQEIQPHYKPQPTFSDFINEYPHSLHSVYIQRKQSFLQACSLKLQLNLLNDNSEKQASILQWKIYKCFEQMDKCEQVLRHWKQTKRMLPVSTNEDFSQTPPVKWELKRRNLRSNKSKRLKTIANLEKSIAQTHCEKEKQTLRAKLYSKWEDLKKLDLQIEKLTELIENE